MIIHTPSPDGTTLVEPDFSLYLKETHEPKPNFITKNGFYFDNSILEQIKQSDGTINFEFRSFCAKDGEAVYYNNILGHLHRTDGPAAIYPDGTIEYWYRGQLHNPHGPAITTPHNGKIWFQNDRKHRLDGPAVIWPDGTEEYWLNGTQVTKADLPC